MIVDLIGNSGIYEGLFEGVVKGLKLLKDSDLTSQEDGRYEVDGDDLFYLIQRYSTNNKEDTLFEAHRDYIDIQAVIEGEETIGYGPIGRMGKVIQPYEPDVIKYADPPVFTELKLTAGMFAIFYPDDAHKPCYHTHKSNVHKLVVKVRIQASH